MQQLIRTPLTQVRPDPQLTRAEFEAFARLVLDHTGIVMSEKKVSLVAGRLARRLRVLGHASYGEYLDVLRADRTGEELAVFIDLMTTHVTQFFREPQHFTWLAGVLPTVRQFPFRVWSAAVSTGEEAYSTALVLLDRLGADRWEVLGTDVSPGSVARAEACLYPMTGASQIPQYYLEHFCLKGLGSMEGYFTFNEQIRSGVRFDVLNLMDFSGLPGGFAPDLILLRNALIYFNHSQQRQILANVAPLLSPGGILMVGHSESLATLQTDFRLVQTAVYVKS